MEVVETSKPIPPEREEPVAEVWYFHFGEKPRSAIEDATHRVVRMGNVYSMQAKRRIGWIELHEFEASHHGGVRLGANSWEAMVAGLILEATKARKPDRLVTNLL